MLKKRIIAVLPIINNIVVQSVNFNTFLPVGKLEIAIEYLNKWEIDEIIILDIKSRKNSQLPNLDLLEKVSKFSNVPIAFGGGVTSVEQAVEIIALGADKIVFNNPILSNTTLVSDTIKLLGQQCVVASVDFVIDAGVPKIYSYLEKRVIDIDFYKYFSFLEDLGVGEIMLNSVDRDGSKSGYELNIYKEISQLMKMPILACGGAGSFQDIEDLFNMTNVSAACVGNYFHYTEHSVIITKSCISSSNQIRHDSYVKYDKKNIDSVGRLLKKEDSYLEDLIFTKIEKEII
jgi:imidazole glycerol-phosphate synthase subunit HisF